MRKVSRFPQPESLKRHSAQWTRELMDEIDKQGSYAKVNDSFKNKYRQDDVKETLEKMYKKHCCYCEAIVGLSSYGRIEQDDIDRFLKLNLTTGEYEVINHSKRALTTINHTGMNRESLVRARRKRIIRFLKDYKAHKSCGDARAFCDEWIILKEDMEYPSLYEELMSAVE